MWYGPFRVAERIDRHAARLETAGTEYRLFPTVHVSKPVKAYPDRPAATLTGAGMGRVDFDESLLPEDSWERELDDNKFEVERIADVRSGRRTRSSRALREYFVYWKGSPDPSWIDEENLNCGTLLRNCERKQTGRNRFEMKNSQEEQVVERPRWAGHRGGVRWKKDLQDGCRFQGGGDVCVE
ncbi:hypothetical protein PI125_g13878 [Phytophthora idaei]|nr:hypothetical protein PI125_g13878 [Phytophthora idaei]KAG3137513.1 hypothetical protein PI126_g17365 [Phytophthora idaei]